MPEVFISFSTKNQSLRDEIQQLLEELGMGISIWDHTSMVAASSLAEQLREAISRSDLCVLLATMEAMASGWCLAEVGAFWGAGKRVIVFTEDADFDDKVLPPQFHADLRARTRESLKEAVRYHLPPILPQPKRRPAVLLNLGSDPRDENKRVVIRSAFALAAAAEGEIGDASGQWEALTRDQLSRWDGLLLACPYRKHLTERTIAELIAWVRAGGRLALTGFDLGEWHHGTNINQLARHFGVGFNSDVVVDRSHDGNLYDKQYGRPICFEPREGSVHPLVAGVTTITLRSACSLRLEPGATSLVPTSPNKIFELDDNTAEFSISSDGHFILATGTQKFRAPEEIARRAVIAQAPTGLTGKGRVIAMGTWDFRARDDNQVFLQNLWKWLAKLDETKAN